MGRLPYETSSNGRSHYAQSLTYEAPSQLVRPHCSALLRWSSLPVGFDEWVPSANAQILIRVAGSACLETLRGNVIELPESALVGPASGTTRIVASADFCAYGIVLTAAGLKAVSRMPASELVDVAVPVEGAGSPADLTAFIEEAGNNKPDAMWLSLEDVLLGLIDPAATVDERTTTITQWMGSSLNPPLSRLQADLGLSVRQTERVVTSIFGLAPKKLSMRLRAHRTAARLALGHSRSAADCDGFYDQAHLIHEFRRFIGTTPSRLARGETFVHHTLVAAHTAGASLI